ncbi:MAG TPA: hypothetical protein VE889_00870, partial [Actinomycetota bacterium]|nr:hypothetical protein [Actinomycetota bacterium]
MALGSAARRWGFRGFEDDPVSIAIVGEGNHKRLPFEVLRFGRDCLIHVTGVDDFRMTTIPRTVMDLLGRRHSLAKWMLDRSLIDGKSTLADYWFLHDDPEMKG